MTLRMNTIFTFRNDIKNEYLQPSYMAGDIEVSTYFVVLHENINIFLSFRIWIHHHFSYESEVGYY